MSPWVSLVSIIILIQNYIRLEVLVVLAFIWKISGFITSRFLGQFPMIRTYCINGTFIDMLNLAGYTLSLIWAFNGINGLIWTLGNINHSQCCLCVNIARNYYQIWNNIFSIWQYPLSAVCNNNGEPQIMVRQIIFVMHIFNSSVFILYY